MKTRSIALPIIATFLVSMHPISLAQQTEPVGQLPTFNVTTSLDTMAPDHMAPVDFEPTSYSGNYYEALCQTLVGSRTDVRLWSVYPGSIIPEHSLILLQNTRTSPHSWTLEFAFANEPIYKSEKKKYIPSQIEVKRTCVTITEERAKKIIGVWSDALRDVRQPDYYPRVWDGGTVLFYCNNRYGEVSSGFTGKAIMITHLGMSLCRYAYAKDPDRETLLKECDALVDKINNATYAKPDPALSPVVVPSFADNAIQLMQYPTAKPPTTVEEIHSAAASVIVEKSKLRLSSKIVNASQSLAQQFFDKPAELKFSNISTDDWTAKWQIFADALEAKAKSNNLDAASLKNCFAALNQGRNRQTLVIPRIPQKYVPYFESDNTPEKKAAWEKDAQGDYEAAMEHWKNHPEKWQDNRLAIIPVSASLGRYAKGDCWIIVCKWEYIVKGKSLPLRHVMAWAMDAKTAEVIAYVTCS